MQQIKTGSSSHRSCGAHLRRDKPSQLRQFLLQLEGKSLRQLQNIPPSRHTSSALRERAAALGCHGFVLRTNAIGAKATNPQSHKNRTAAALVWKLL